MPTEALCPDHRECCGSSTVLEGLTATTRGGGVDIEGADKGGGEDAEGSAFVKWTKDMQEAAHRSS